MYLGVTLDRTLTYKKHCVKTRQKVIIKNNLFRTSNTKETLCFSAAEYACPESGHTKEVDNALNEVYRITTGCVKATLRPALYNASGSRIHIKN